MPDEPKLKSSYELAMERLEARDKEAGVDPRRPLTREQKEEITRVRQEHKAKLAELEILYRDKRATETDPEKLKELEEHNRIDRERAESSLNSAIEKVKS